MPTSLYTTFILFVAVCFFILSQRAPAPAARPLPLWLALLFLPLTFALSLLMFPSDPATWSFANVVLYLATPSLDPLRLLAVTVIGGALFFGVVYLLYGSRPRRPKRK